MNRFEKWLAAGLCAITISALAYMVGIAWAQTTGTFPTANNSLSLGNSVTQILPANPTRRALLICNVGATNDAWITPIAPAGQTQIVVAALGAGSFLLSRNSAAAANVTNNCLLLGIGLGGSLGSSPGITNLVTAGFNGITNAGTTPLTVWEF